ncbi:MAG: ABC transporter ATP-binding protein [Metallosphaera yellowstonensis]|jgi:ABC-type multidrug transport system, ATPase component
MEGVEVIELKKSYGRRKALAGISLRAEPGKVTVILGPNGAGKTTLIRSLMTLIFPDSGQVRILGRDPFRHKEVFNRVGYVQELPNLPPFMSGRELLEFSARIKGVPREEVDHVLELVDMRENANRKIAKYSKGMTQRIALAEALLGEPDVLVMDEPNVGTDPVLNLRLRQELEKRKREGTSILISTHELEEVKRLGDEVYFLFNGELFFKGTVEELVLRFLGVRVVVETCDRESLLGVLKRLDYVMEVKESGNRFLIRLSSDKREEFLRELVLNEVRVRGFFLDQSLEEAYEAAVREAVRA